MAATGKTPILLYGSTTPTNVPSAGNLTNSSDGCEIAINVADKNLFFKDSTNAVNTVPIRQSSASSNGWLSSTDWSTFNSKQPAGSYALTTGTLAQFAATTSAQLAGVISDETGSGSLVFGTSPTIGTPVITGGSINNATIGATTANTGKFTTLDSTGLATLGPSAGGLQLISTNGSYPGSNTYFATQADGAQRIRIGHYDSATVAFPTGLVPAQILAGVTNLDIASRDNATGSITLRTGSGVTAKLTIAAGGDVTVNTGNLVIGTSGKGIDFSATAGTGTSELLADYEEGDWTPVLAGTTTAGTGTYTSQVGNYTKVGRLVYVKAALTWSAHTGTGNMIITGLPYTSGAGGLGRSVGSLFITLITYTGTFLQAYTIDSSTTIYLEQTTSNAATSGIPIDTAGTVYVSMCYQV